MTRLHDVLRPRLWQEEDVSWWYRQNVLLFCDVERVGQIAALSAARDATHDGQLSIVHPILYGWMVTQRDRLAAELDRPPALREVLNMLPGAAARAVRRRTRRRNDGDH